jgi:hypothetical protein
LGAERRALENLGLNHVPCEKLPTFRKFLNFMNSEVVILIPTYPFTFSSAGILSQHQLCNTLRESGLNAYLIIIKGDEILNPAWDTPVWRGTIYPLHSIAIYSELIHGNPLEASYVVSWVMGKFILPPKPRSHNSTTLFWNNTDQYALRLNNLDYNFFYPASEKKRNGIAYYQGKNAVWSVNKKGYGTVVSIRRFGKSKLSRNDLRDVLQRSTALLIAEDSLIIQEAIVAGCPVIVEPGTQINTYGKIIPSLYLRKTLEDWPNLELLTAQIEESRAVIQSMISESESSIKNLARVFDGIEFVDLAMTCPRESFRKLALIRIFMLRVKSAYVSQGVKGLTSLIFEGTSSKINGWNSRLRNFWSQLSRLLGFGMHLS